MGIKDTKSKKKWCNPTVVIIKAKQLGKGDMSINIFCLKEKRNDFGNVSWLE